MSDILRHYGVKGMTWEHRRAVRIDRKLANHPERKVSEADILTTKKRLRLEFRLNRAKEKTGLFKGKNASKLTNEQILKILRDPVMRKGVKDYNEKKKADGKMKVNALLLKNKKGG